MPEETFYDAKPVKSGTKTSDITDPLQEIDDELTLAQIQKLLYLVQDREEWAVRRMATLYDEKSDAEEAWLAHESVQLILIKDRLDSEDSKEKSSDKLRQAEIFQARDEEGNKGLALYKAWQAAENKLKVADRYCKMLESRRSALQTLNGNLKNVT